MAKRSEAQKLAYAKLMGIPAEEITAKPKKRVVTLWEQCRVCAEQMTGGPRCMAHNPLPVDDRPYVRNVTGLSVRNA